MAVRIGDVPTDIRTEHLISTNIESYRYGDPFDNYHSGSLLFEEII
jgi:hypothetical protein